jgi:hypothetical protein
MYGSSICLITLAAMRNRKLGNVAAE